MNPIIEVKEVYKSFKNVQAVNGISLSVFEGQFTALLGPNGAGKTTLVEMIEGIQKPDKGDIFILGKKWKGNEDELHRIIGLSLQETHFIDKLTARETLTLFAAFYDLGRQRVAEVIDIIGLGEKQNAYVVGLSGGQRQRLALGIALLNKPRILLLDEPTTGLDPNARREIWAILFYLKEHAQTSLILTTHYMEEAAQLCDNVIIIDKGRILKQGTLDQLLNEDHEEKIIEFTLEKTNQSVETLQHTIPLPIKWDPRFEKGILSVSRLETEIPAFFSYLKERHIRLKNLECRRKTLDDVFTSLTGRRLNE